MKKISLLVLTVITLFLSSFTLNKKPVLYPELNSFIHAAEKNFGSIPEERQKQLKKLSLYVKSKLAAEKKVSLVFICTHNSRRSHMAQLWSLAAANYYRVKGVSTYSGGTEATAFNPIAVKTLISAGFKIDKKSDAKNPIYTVKFADGVPAAELFSKKYMDAPNPTNNFAAVMTCSQADKTCPNVQGASLRIAIPYEDPKASDGTPQQDAVYKERSKQIATEMAYVFSQLKK